MLYGDGQERVNDDSDFPSIVGAFYFKEGRTYGESMEENIEAYEIASHFNKLPNLLECRCG
jgi:hypothetical protein